MSQFCSFLRKINGHLDRILYTRCSCLTRSEYDTGTVVNKYGLDCHGEVESAHIYDRTYTKAIIYSLHVFDKS